MSETYIDVASIRLKALALSPEEAAEMLDQAISELYSAILSLKSLRNKHVARINSLPEDVIAMLLMEAVALEPFSPPAPGRWKELTQLIAVCRSWRAVALDCPALWATIPSSPPPG